jgi:tRNA pseudouridine55 synthase
MDVVLVVDKPVGISSFDVIRELQSLIGEVKMGHTGTLDPKASGILVVCMGWATRIVPFLTDDEKVYEAIVRLGETTSSYDTEGEVITKAPVPALSFREVDESLEEFRGQIMQRPPAFSALHVDGTRAYQLARKGEEVRLEKRSVTVKELTLLDLDLPDILLRCHVSKGTYIRSLAHDIGQRLGCGGHLASLRRVRAGKFHLHDAVTLDELRRADEPVECIYRHAIPMGEALDSLLRVPLEAEEAWNYVNGVAQPVADDHEEGAAVVVREEDGLFLGLGEVEVLAECTQVRPLRTYATFSCLE